MPPDHPGLSEEVVLAHGDWPSLCPGRTGGGLGPMPKSRPWKVLAYMTGDRYRPVRRGGPQPAAASTDASATPPASAASERAAGRVVSSGEVLVQDDRVYLELHQPSWVDEA
jgi:hypothetical protein